MRTMGCYSSDFDVNTHFLTCGIIHILMKAQRGSHIPLEFIKTTHIFAPKSNGQAHRITQAPKTLRTGFEYSKVLWIILLSKEY